MQIGVSGYIGKSKTGIGRTLENVLLELAQIDNNNTYYLFVNYDQKELIDRQWPLNVKIIKYNVSKNSRIGNILWHQYFYQKALRIYKCDISFIPNFSLLLWKNMPTVVVIHDLIEFNIPSKFSKPQIIYRHLAVPMMARHADRIITVSENSKKDIIKYCKVREDKIAVAYNGCDHSVFKKLADDEIRERLKRYSLLPYSYILYVGTIDYPGKNVLSLIKGFFDLREKYDISQKLVVAGNPSHNSDIVFNFVKHSRFSEEVLFLGYVIDEDLPVLLNGATVFCFLSFYEGFGLPLLEAMSCGCPVIAADTSSLPEVVGDAGIIVNPNDIEEISNAIYRVINSSDLRYNMKTKGLLRSKQFSWEKAADQYFGIIQNLSANRA